MVRAAAKNHAHVGVVVDPAEYPVVLKELREAGTLSAETRRRLARAAFAHTAAYDAAIVGWFDAGGAGGSAELFRPPCTWPWSWPPSCATGRTPINAGPATGPSGNRPGGTGSSSTPGRPFRTSTCSTPTPPGGWSTTCSGPTPRPWPSSSTPTPAGRRWPTTWPAPTAGPSSAIRCPPSVGWWPWAVPARRPWPGPWPTGPQADVIIAPGWEPEAVDILVARRKSTRLLEAPPYGGAARRDPQSGRRLSGPGRRPLRDDAVGLGRWPPRPSPPPSSGATSSWPGGCAPGRPPTPSWWWPTARPSASGPVSRAGSRRPRSPCARPAPGAVGAAAASDAFFPFRDGLDVLAAAGVAVVVQPGRVGERRRGGGGGRRAGGRPWSSPANATSGTEGRRRCQPSILNGETVAARIRAEVADAVAQLKRSGIQPGLGTILVGDDPASARYVAMKHEDCAEVGIVSVHEHLPADVGQDELEAVIARFNADPAVHAYLVQIPLPAGLDEERGPAGRRSGQGRRRPASREPGPPGHGHPRASALHAGRHRRAPGRLRRARRGSPRGRHRPGTHHRSSPGPPADPQTTRLQRRGHRGAHRRGRSGRAGAHGRRGGGGGRVGRPRDPRHGASRGRPWSGRARRGPGASSCPTWTRPWPRWPVGSRPASAGWAP